MQDIIFNMNFNKSSNGRCIIETFAGTIKHINKKTFSGPLKPTSIENIDSCGNIPPKILKLIKDIFINDESNQISKFKYVFTQEGLLVFLNLISGYDGLYCTTLDGSLHEIESVIQEGMISAKISEKNQRELELYLYQKSQTVKFTEKIFVYSLNTKTLIYFSNKIYIIEQNLNDQCIMNIVKKKFKTPKKFNLESIFEYTTKDYFFSKENKLISIKPNPVLYVYFDNDEIVGSLNFSYNNTEIKSNSKMEYVKDNEIDCYRDILEENRYTESLIKNGWRKSKGEFFIFENINSFDKMFDNLDKDFILLTPDKKRIISPSKVSFNFGYNIKWFEVSATVKVNSKFYDIMPLINISNNRQRFVEIDGELVLLPNIIVEKKDILKKRNESIIIEKNDIGHVLEMSGQLNTKHVMDLEEFIDFGNIKLDIPEYLQSVLREYQVEGVKWLKYLYKNSFGGCLADDMGLGKTIQTIAFLSDHELIGKSLFRAIIIVPKTLIVNWKQEFNKFNKQLIVTVYHGINRENILNEYRDMSGVLITTYNTVLNDIDKLSSLHFDCMFLDEAQYIKNSNSKTYIALKKVNSDIKIALSGTPFENNIGELWAIMNLLNPNCLGSRVKFMKQYSNCYQDKEMCKRINLRIKPFVLRRLKSNVLKELPEKIEQNIVCSMSEQQRELYDAMLHKIQFEIERLPERFEIKSNSIILEGLLYLRQICCHPMLLSRELNINNCKESDKFELFKLKIEELQSLNKKVVVFSQFTKMLKIMERWAKKNNWKTFYLDGKTKKRQELVDNFEASKEGILFISLKAGGVGLNIVSCQYAIIYDPWWNPAVENQAADRIYRIGQTNNVYILKFITENSIEEKIQNLKSIKSSISEALFENTSTVKSITISELKDLLY